MTRCRSWTLYPEEGRKWKRLVCSKPLGHKGQHLVRGVIAWQILVRKAKE